MRMRGYQDAEQVVADNTTQASTPVLEEMTPSARQAVWDDETERHQHAAQHTAEKAALGQTLVIVSAVTTAIAVIGSWLNGFSKGLLGLVLILVVADVVVMLALIWANLRKPDRFK